MTRTKKTPSSKSISIEDVARESGVSITTVSRVINKVGTVKEKNRAKVMSVVKDLKFQPSIFAQRLATGKTNVVALVIPRYEGVFYSFYGLEVIRGVGTLCEALKLDLLLHLTDTPFWNQDMVGTVGTKRRGAKVTRSARTLGKPSMPMKATSCLLRI